MREESILYVVATPIGNLGDMSPRAREILSSVDLIAAEDTRHTRQLLQLLDIKGKPMISCFDHNEQQRAGELVTRMREEMLAVALVSDAGTPCISDPGFRVVAEARRAGIKVCPIPGPSAMVTLISAAGLPCDRFVFIGFLPSKESALLREIEQWKKLRVPVIFFETGPRIGKSLSLIQAHLPKSQMAVGRELTKLYEDIMTGTVEDVLARILAMEKVRGELVCMLSPADDEASIAADLQQSRDAIIAQAREAFAEGATHKELRERFRDCGLTKKELFDLLLSLKNTE